MTKKIEELEEILKKNNVAVGRLCVVYSGTDQIIGEEDTVSLGEIPNSLKLHNPKRIIRMQMQDRGGLVLHYLISNLDLMIGGAVDVRPNAMYRVVDQPEATKRLVYELYVEFFERKRQQEIAESGLVIPTTVASPFKK